MGPVAQQVFKTCAVWQPHARSVRLRRRSVKPLPARLAGLVALGAQTGRVEGIPVETARSRVAR